VPGLEVTLKEGWKLFLYQGCRFAVPESWHEEGSLDLMRGPDGSSLAIRKSQSSSWSAHKAQIRAAYVHLKVVHEDSDRRFWFEIGDAPLVQHYVAVTNSATICTGLLEVRSNTMADREDTINRIAGSIGPAPKKWSPDAK
jgi:hypothetical protein